MRDAEGGLMDSEEQWMDDGEGEEESEEEEEGDEAMGRGAKREGKAGGRKQLRGQSQKQQQEVLQVGGWEGGGRRYRSAQCHSVDNLEVGKLELATFIRQTGTNGAVRVCVPTFPLLVVGTSSSSCLHAQCLRVSWVSAGIP